MALFLVQAGFHGFTATLPLALAGAGRSDAEIGALVGISALVQIGGALAGGALTDRFGGIRLFVLGGICYLIACGLLYLAGTAESGTAMLIAARVLQGAGFGFAVPSALSVVPGLVPVERRGVAIATAGSAHNLTLVAIPPVSIVVFYQFGLTGVTVFVSLLVMAGLALALARPFRVVSTAESALGAAKRRFGFAYRHSWRGPLAITIFFVIHWGVLIAYLPQRAEAAGANIGLFFAADGLFVLLTRIPAGWLADHMRPVVVVVAGIAMTAVAVAMLLTPLTTPMLILAGILTGTGAALIVQPLMLALTERSSDADRGSAFALFSATFSAGIAIGTIGTAPLVETVGFATLLAAAFGALVVSAIVAFADSGLRQSPGATRRGAVDNAELATEVGTPIGP